MTRQAQSPKINKKTRQSITKKKQRIAKKNPHKLNNKKKINNKQFTDK